MRLAKRYTLIPGFRSLPPLLTAASTTKAWPSSTFASPALHENLFACIPLTHPIPTCKPQPCSWQALQTLQELD